MKNHAMLRFFAGVMLLTLLPTTAVPAETQPAQANCCTSCLACWATWGPQTITIGGAVVSLLLATQIKDALKKLATEQPDVFKVLKALVNNEAVAATALAFVKPVLQKLSLMNDNGTINDGVMAVLKVFLSATNDADIPLKESKTITRALRKLEQDADGQSGCCNSTCCIVAVNRADPVTSTGCCSKDCSDKCMACCQQYAPIFIKIGEWLIDLIAAQTVKKSLILMKAQDKKNDTETFDKYCNYCKQGVKGSRAASNVKSFGINNRELLRQYNLANDDHSVNMRTQKLVDALVIRQEGEYKILTIKQAIKLGRLEKVEIYDQDELRELEKEMVALGLDATDEKKVTKKQVLVEKKVVKKSKKKSEDYDADDDDDSDDN